jgi:hypothetical protein
MVISMFAGIKDDYVQVVVLQPRYHERLEAMGWVKDPELLPDELPVVEPEKPAIENSKNSVESVTKPSKSKVPNDSGRTD